MWMSTQVSTTANKIVKIFRVLTVVVATKDLNLVQMGRAAMVGYFCKLLIWSLLGNFPSDSFGRVF